MEKGHFDDLVGELIADAIGKDEESQVLSGSSYPDITKDIALYERLDTGEQVTFIQAVGKALKKKLRDAFSDAMSDVFSSK